MLGLGVLAWCSWCVEVEHGALTGRGGVPSVEQYFGYPRNCSVWAMVSNFSVFHDTTHFERAGVWLRGDDVVPSGVASIIGQC
ncbi:hypothetical protein [Falsihalocynthiibacter sp. CO-5D18]|uniref:hypothetical protein n=1 Tax=Falsihalocynthiibacter sp. CO-5D18 TaxID=3240872 RepID=UPI00350EB1C2